MKGYIMTIIGAALLAAMSGIIAPEKWRGYVKIITSLVIISCIASPVFTAFHSGIWEGFDQSFEAAGEGENLRSRIVGEELTKRINADIEKRLKDEFNTEVRADCEIGVTADGNVEGVRNIYIYGARLSDGAKNRLCEVYGVEPGDIHDE